MWVNRLALVEGRNTYKQREDLGRLHKPRCFRVLLGKSTRGFTNGGLSPKFSEKIGQKSFQENRAFSGPIGAFSGPIGAFLRADRDRSLCTSQPLAGSRNFPRKGLLGPIGAFWAKPPFAKPPVWNSPLDFLQPQPPHTRPEYEEN